MPTVCADATYLPFRKQAFNCVVSLETLEHIKDQRVFLTILRAALRKVEGRF
jgi:ubiquinone/menaquinone biosynthesis C-methylase UbiE